VLLALFCSCAATNRYAAASDTIEYRGERIKLSKAYSDFDVYKNDPDNIHPSETERVQRLVMEAPIAREFDNLLEVSKAVVDLSFPGYGTGGFEEKKHPDGTSYIAFMIEIPRAEKDRYFAFRGVNGKYQLIDDFIAPEHPYISTVDEQNGSLVYSGPKGQRVMTRPLVIPK